MGEETTLAFDVYGTLIDPLGIVEALRPHAGEQAAQLAALWRQKQVEYAFRRGLMGAYVDFDLCTEQALQFAAEACGVTLAEEARRAVLDAYQRLPAYPDALPALADLHSRGCRCVAFTNGVAATVGTLLERAGLGTLLEEIVSVDEVQTYKPNPAVYQHLARRLAVQPHDVWLVSANAWDVIGARAAGLRAIWVRRAGAPPFDPWGSEPELELPELGELAGRLGLRHDAV